jgi:hypothetical protein
MATINAAELSGNADHLGSLAPGHLADLIVVMPNIPFEPPSGRHDAWWTLTHASPAQLALVTVAGRAILGDPELLSQMTSTKGEAIPICNAQKTLLLTGSRGHADSANEPFAATNLILLDAMQHLGRRLAPIAECGN